MLREISVQYCALENGETLAYRLVGNQKPVLLLIHGNMSSSVHYDTVMERLESEYTIYAVDLRGFGDSSYNKPVESLLDFALDVEAFMDLVGIEECVVAGWSTGGGVALELAALLPDQVKKVILIESVGIKGYPMFKKAANGQPILTEQISSYEDIKNDAVQVVPALVAQATQNKEYFRFIYNLVIYNKNQPEEERYERYLEAILKQRNLVDVDYSLVHFNMTNESNGVCDGSNRIALVQIPVLIIQGEDDLVVPPMFAQLTKQHLGDRARLELFKNSGHSPLTDQFELLIATMRSFINQ